MNGTTHPANFIVRSAPSEEGMKRRNVLLPVFEGTDFRVSVYALNAIYRVYHNVAEAFPVGGATASVVAELVREMNALSRTELLEIRGLTNDAIDTLYAWLERYEMGCRSFEAKVKAQAAPVVKAAVAPVVDQRDLFIAAAITGLTNTGGRYVDTDRVAFDAIQIADAVMFELSKK